MSGIQRTLFVGNADKIASNFADNIAAGYQAALTAAGGSIGATQLAAVKTFVKTGFKDRWWFSLIDCGLFLGADLTSALVKIVAAPGTGSSYVNHNLVAGDYGLLLGIQFNLNSTKYLSTGIIPINLGLSLTDMSLVCGTSTLATTQGLWGCDEANVAQVACVGGEPNGAHGNRGNSVAWTRAYSCGASYMPAWSGGAQEGIGVMDYPGNSCQGSLDTEIEIFRTMKFGIRYIAGSAQIGFFSIGRMLTIVQLRSMTAAVLRLHRAARSITSPPRFVFIGDSITHGRTTSSQAATYPMRVANARSGQETVIGLTGSEMMTSSISSLAGRFRYKGTETFPIAKFFCMLGSNDIAVEDVTTNGDAAVIAVYRSYIATMANVLKGQGAQVVILSIPWTTRANETKVLAWVDGALGAASDAGVIGIDTCRPMIASGDPQQYVTDDVHLNDAGHLLVANMILAVI